MNSDFYTIGKKSESDKIYHHGYHRFYDKYIKRDIKKLLEIGIEQGHSVNLWLQYCPKAIIYGLDIKTEFINNRVSIYKGDQSNQKDLEKLILHTGSDIDVIVDDGSHIPEHQLFSFDKLFSHINPGGIYIIEDIETSYWKKGGLYGYETRYGKDHNMNIVNIFKYILHLLNKEFMNNDDITELGLKCPVSLETIDSISSVTFCQNCIIIRKKELYEYPYVNRQYRFQQML
jgi:hypothetical protein